MSNFFTKSTTGGLLGLAGFGIALYTSPMVLQFAATIGSYMSSFIGAVPALFAGLALTAGLCILAGVAAVLIAVAISKAFAAKPTITKTDLSDNFEQSSAEPVLNP